MNVLPKLTVICPVNNEEQSVSIFFNRIKIIFESISNRYDPNLLFIDNSSEDNTRNIIAELCGQNPFVYLIALSANFGYQASVECGLRNAKGDLFVVIDVDCEDPPELIVEFLQKHEDGWDVVYGERADRHEPTVLKILRKIYYRITRYVSDDDFVVDMAEFCLVTSAVRDAIIQDSSSFPFIRASIGRVGFQRIGIPYKRQKRVAGESHYNLIRMTLFGIAGILSSSTLPLRVSAYLFPFWSIAMITLGILHVYNPSPWSMPLLIVLGFLFCGFTGAFFSIYIARAYKNGLRRPNYFINQKFSIFQK